ncbi:hypothetical protein D3C71_1656110 [compost metagenome]
MMGILVEDNPVVSGFVYQLFQYLCPDNFVVGRIAGDVFRKNHPCCQFRAIAQVPVFQYMFSAEQVFNLFFGLWIALDETVLQSRDEGSCGGGTNHHNDFREALKQLTQKVFAVMKTFMNNLFYLCACHFQSGITVIFLR